MEACLVDDCVRVLYRYGLCRRHHYRHLTYGDPNGGGPLRDTEHTEQCVLPGCTEPYLAKGLCAMHYARRRIHEDPLYQPTFDKDQPCAIKKCTALQIAKGYCGKHYQRVLKYGDPDVFLKGEVGKGTVNSSGYRIIFRPWHPNANKHGRLPEHRLVMAEMLGRPLLKEEVVHHRNGNRLDNRPENLELWLKTQPPGQRVEDLVAWARAIIAQYGELEQYANLQEFTANRCGD